MQHAHDVVSYPGVAYWDTHPDRVAVMAKLHGLHPTPVANCRVLEVGCNEGSNLIPMAYAIPGTEFVGFDIAGHPVALAQEKIRALALTNIRVFQASIEDIDQQLGKFDYIIAHGVYAWIAEQTRDSLLALCRNHLTANGIAFISYNALPGGHIRNMIREILMERATCYADPLQGVSAGLELLKSIVELRPKDDPLATMLGKESLRLQKHDPRYIYHDELSQEQHPVLFSTFAAHAAQHNLRYVCESVVAPLNDPANEPRVAAMARQTAGTDRIAEEQILDFVRMRGYRETLLCHSTAEPSSDICMDALKGMSMASQAKSSKGATPEARLFTLPGGITMETSDIHSIAVIEYLTSHWPQSVAYPDLAEFLEASGIEAGDELLTVLLALVSARAIQLHVWDAPVSMKIAERPCASASGRLEALTHGMMTTLHHHRMVLADQLVRDFLSLLDGSRDRNALSKALCETHPEIPESAVLDGIETSLRLLQRAGVLVEDNFRCAYLAEPCAA